MLRPSLLSLIVVFSLGGCTVGPDYVRPEVETPRHYRFATGQGQPGAVLGWWKQFNDPVLTGLIDEALARNVDLYIATARLQEYQSIYVGTGGPLYPQLTLPVTGNRTRQGSAMVSSTYQANISVFWEVDFWGRIRRLSEAARADYLGQEEARHAVVLSLVSAVATSYIQLRELDARLEIARRTLAARTENKRLAALRFEAGAISEMETRQANFEHQNTLLSVQQLEQAVVQKEHEVSLLLGRNPGPVERGRAIFDLVLPAVPPGLPSELLGRRPDVRQAEQALVAANARIGAAKASLFPTISLTGSYGSASPELSDLFSGPARLWSFVPGISLPIFSGGTLWAQLTASEARRDQALGAYQKAIQSAFRETEDTLIGVTKTGEQQATQASALSEVRRYAYLARLRYDDGVTSYLEVLDSQRNLFSAEQGLAQAQSAALVAVINLYKALGGDWDAAPTVAVPRQTAD